MIEKRAYSKINDRYGVVYNPIDGGIDSFFVIGDKTGKNLGLEDVIEKEGAVF